MFLDYVSVVDIDNQSSLHPFLTSLYRLLINKLTTSTATSASCCVKSTVHYREMLHGRDGHKMLSQLSRRERGRKCGRARKKRERDELGPSTVDGVKNKDGCVRSISYNNCLL